MREDPAREVKLLNDLKKLKEGEPMRVMGNANVREVCLLMCKKNWGAVAVFEENVLVGTISKREILEQVILLGKNPANMVAKNIVNRNFEILTSPVDPWEALNLMLSKDHYNAVVIDPLGNVEEIVSFENVMLDLNTYLARENQVLEQVSCVDGPGG